MSRVLGPTRISKIDFHSFYYEESGKDIFSCLEFLCGYLTDKTSQATTTHHPPLDMAGVVKYDAPQGGKVLTYLDRACLAWHGVRGEVAEPCVLLKSVSLPDGEAKGERRRAFWAVCR